MWARPPWAATRTIDAMIAGRISDEEADFRLPDLRAECARLERELAAADTVPEPIALHPKTIERYLEAVEDLAAAMRGDFTQSEREPLAEASGRSCMRSP